MANAERAGAGEKWVGGFAYWRDSAPSAHEPREGDDYAKAEVRYLVNSGFIVQRGKRCLIFDYIIGTVGKSAGQRGVCPKE
jgi:hypothetical protein